MAKPIGVVCEPEPEWLDKMVTKLKTVLEAQLKRVDEATSEAAVDRAADARILATLERTLEKLSKLEQERAAAREKKVTKNGAGARAALERRLDQRLAAIEKSATAGKPGRG